MKERTLLDVMSNIDDSWIEEAAHPEILLNKKRRSIISAKLGTIAACMVVVFGLIAAVPYMKLFVSKAESAVDMNAMIQSALAEQSQAHAEKDASLHSSAALEQELQDSQNDALQSSMQAAADSIASSVMSLPQSEIAPGKSTDMAVTDPMPEEPQTNVQKIDELLWEYSGNVLYSLKAEENILLTDLVIPAMLDGVEITVLADDFWAFCDSAPKIATVTIPSGIDSFGNAELLPKTVKIICASGSPAEYFFSKTGYIVETK